MTKIVFSVPKNHLQTIRKCSQEIHWTLDQTTLLALNDPWETNQNPITKSPKITPNLNWEWMMLPNVSPEIELQLDVSRIFRRGRIQVIVLNEPIGLKTEIVQISLRGETFESIDLEDCPYVREVNGFRKINFFNLSELMNALAKEEIVVTIKLEYVVERSRIENDNYLQSVKSLKTLSSEVVLSYLSTQNAILLYDSFGRIGLDLYKKHVIKFITENWEDMISENGLDNIRTNYTLTFDCLDLLLKK